MLSKIRAGALFHHKWELLPPPTGQKPAFQRTKYSLSAGLKLFRYRPNVQFISLWYKCRLPLQVRLDVDTQQIGRKSNFRFGGKIIAHDQTTKKWLLRRDAGQPFFKILINRIACLQVETSRTSPP